MLLPVGITFKDWASQIRIDLPDILIPNPPKVNNWRDWATQIVYNNSIYNIPLPTKSSYPHPEDWRKWASYFITSF